MFADLGLSSVIGYTRYFIYSVWKLMLTRFGPASVSKVAIIGFNLDRSIPTEAPKV